MNYQIITIRKNEVKKLLSDSKFLTDWSNLAKTDQKCSVIQEPPFVITWYNQYDSEFDPLLMIAYNEDKNLVGFMPLAIEKKTEKLVHAGAWQAEYHGWIAHPYIDNSFPIHALISIQNEFDLKTWQWRCLPPKCPISWINSPLLKKHKIFVEYTIETSHIWDLTDQEKMKKIRNNRSIKTKINRFKKIGKFYIERIKDKDKTKLLLKDLKNQTDFRQMAAHNISPFAKDPFKEDFFVEKLNYPDSFHFTVLWCEQKPIAFHHGACDNQTIYIGLSGFDPTESKNSPGTLLLVYLADLASAEGYRYIDLTPGGDEYKKRFATNEQTLYIPTFYFNRFQKIKSISISETKKIAKSILSLGGKKPENLKYFKNIDIQEYKNKFKRISFNKIFNKVSALFYEHRIYLYYCLKKDTHSIAVNNSVKVHKQRYSDLLEYGGSNPWVNKQTLFINALQRFASNEILYTITKDNTLAHWGWLTKGGRTHTFTEVDMTFESPPNTFILYDFYTEPKYRRQGLYQKNMQEMINDSFQAGAEEVYIGVRHNNIASKRAIEKMGFVLFRTFSKRKILFFTKKKYY